MAILDNTSLTYMNKRNKGNPVLNQYFATSGNQLTPEALQGMVQGELDARYANQQQQKELQLRREALEYQKMSDQRNYESQQDAIKSARNMGIVSNLVGAGTAIAGNWDKIKDTTVGRGLSSIGGALETGAGAVGDVLKSGYNTLTGAPTSSKLAPMPSGELNTEGLLSYPKATGPQLNTGNLNFSIAGDGRPPLPTSLNLEKNPMMQYYPADTSPVPGKPGNVQTSVFRNNGPVKAPGTVPWSPYPLPKTETQTVAATNAPYTNIKQVESAEGKDFWDISPIKKAWDKTVGREGIGGQLGTWLEATGKFQDDQNAKYMAEVNKARVAGKTPDYAGLRKKYPKSGTGVYGFVRRF